MGRVASDAREGIVGGVPSPSDPSVAAELARVADELARLRATLDAMGQRVGTLVAENLALQARLEQSEVARNDLLAQTEHVIELLADSRREIRALQAKGSAGAGAAPPGA